MLDERGGGEENIIGWGREGEGKGKATSLPSSHDVYILLFFRVFPPAPVANMASDFLYFSSSSYARP